MITIAEEHLYDSISIDLLNRSIVFIKSLYPVEEKDYTYDIEAITKGRFFIIRHHNMAVGCGSYVWRNSDEIELRHIFIDSTVRGMGFGKSLLVHIEQVAKTDGVKKILLETTKKQIEAVALYTKFGYYHCAPYTKYHDGSIFMEKTLF